MNFFFFGFLSGTSHTICLSFTDACIFVQFFISILELFISNLIEKKIESVKLVDFF